MAIKVTVDEKKGKIFIEADIEPGQVSASGKTLVIASTRGNQKTGQKVQGGELTVGLNAYIPNPNRPPTA